MKETVDDKDLREIENLKQNALTAKSNDLSREVSSDVENESKINDIVAAHNHSSVSENITKCLSDSVSDTKVLCEPKSSSSFHFNSNKGGEESCDNTMNRKSISTFLVGAKVFSTSSSRGGGSSSGISSASYTNMRLENKNNMIETSSYTTEISSPISTAEFGAKKQIEKDCGREITPLEFEIAAPSNNIISSVRKDLGLNHNDSIITDSMLEESIKEEDNDAKFRSIIFVYICLLGLVLNLDAGIVPSTLSYIEADFQLNYDQLGTLGALVYIGLSLSCPISGYILSKYENKRQILVIAIFVNMMSALWTCFATSTWELYLCRLLSGFSKGPISIYSPVWVDEFAPDRYQTVWMSLLQANVALGIMFGYITGGLLTAYFGSWWWRGSFLIQSIILVPFFICLLKVKGRYVNTIGSRSKRIKRILQRYLKLVLGELEEDVVLHDQSVTSTTVKESCERTGKTNHRRTVSLKVVLQKRIRKARIAKRRQESRRPARIDGLILSPNFSRGHSDDVMTDMTKKIESFNNTRVRSESISDKLSFSEQLRFLMKCKTWVLITAALSALYFVVTGIQFWVTSYLIEFVGADPQWVIYGFALTSLTGPTLGVFFGGWVIDKAGGYKDDTGKSVTNALRTCLVFGILATICSIFTAFVNEKWLILIGIWFVLFFGGAIVPPATGICISSVPVEMRAFAGAMSILLYNVFGYSAAPLFCGIIAEYTNLQWGFRSVLMMSGIASVFMFLCWLNSYFQLSRNIVEAPSVSSNYLASHADAASTSVRSDGTDREILAFGDLHSANNIDHTEDDNDDNEYEMYRTAAATIGVGISGLFPKKRNMKDDLDLEIDLEL